VKIAVTALRSVAKKLVDVPFVVEALVAKRFVAVALVITPELAERSDATLRLVIVDVEIVVVARVVAVAEVKVALVL
jgi:hypothetical protein